MQAQLFVQLQNFMLVRIKDKCEVIPFPLDEANLERFCVGRPNENELYFVPKTFKIAPKQASGASTASTTSNSGTKLIQNPAKIIQKRVRVGMQDNVDWNLFGIKMRVLSLDISKYPNATVTTLRNLVFQTLYDQVLDSKHDDLYGLLREMQLGAPNAAGKIIFLKISDPIEPFIEGKELDGRLYLASKGYAIPPPPPRKGEKIDRLSVVQRSNQTSNEEDQIPNPTPQSESRKMKTQPSKFENEPLQTTSNRSHAPSIPKVAEFHSKPQGTTERESHLDSPNRRILLVNLEPKDFNWSWVGIDPPILKIEIFPEQTCRGLRDAIWDELTKHCPSDLKDQLLARTKGLCVVEKNIETNQIVVLNQGDSLDPYLGEKMLTHMVYFMQVIGKYSFEIYYPKFSYVKKEEMVVQVTVMDSDRNLVKEIRGVLALEIVNSNSQRLVRDSY